jgi:hypothetical protein
MLISLLLKVSQLLVINRCESERESVQMEQQLREIVFFDCGGGINQMWPHRQDLVYII